MKVKSVANSTVICPVSTVAYLEINIYFMMIIYLVELTATDTIRCIDVFTLTQKHPKNKRAFCPIFDFDGEAVSKCMRYEAVCVCVQCE